MKGLRVDHDVNSGQASLLGAAWRKSSYSSPSGNCVEAATVTSGVALRDSRFPDGPVLIFASTGWGAFLQDVKAECFG